MEEVCLDDDVCEFGPPARARVGRHVVDPEHLDAERLVHRRHGDVLGGAHASGTAQKRMGGRTEEMCK